MLNEALSQRYASAIYEMASEQRIASAVLADLNLIHNTVMGHEELRASLMSPTLGHNVKQSISEKIFASEVKHQLSLHFYMLLLKKGREAFLGDIVELYKSMLNKALDILNVKLQVASAIKPELEELVRANLGKMTGKRVELNVEVCPDLVAGAVISADGNYYDGSLKNQLAEAYKLLKQG